MNSNSYKLEKYGKIKVTVMAELTTYSKQFISIIENNVHQTFSIGTLWRIALVLDIDMYKLCIEPIDEKEGIL